MTIRVEVPISLPSVANLREFWAAKAKRVKAQRTAVAWCLKAALLTDLVGRVAGHRVAVTLTRVAPRKLDSDNLVSACKACRDQVAEYLGVDDGDPRVTWRYAQLKSSRACVLIDLEVT